VLLHRERVAVVMNLAALTALVLSGGDPLRLLFD